MKNENVTARNMALRRKARSYTMQAARLLVSRVDFNADAKVARELLGLPSEGFQSQSEADSWFEANIRFKGGNLGLRHPSPDDSRRIQLSKQLDEICVTLRANYELDHIWSQFIENYLLRGILDERSLPSEIVTKILYEEGTGRPELWVRVDPGMSLANIGSNWSEIKKRQPKRVSGQPNKRQPINTAVAERDKMAYELNMQGVGNAEIAEQINASSLKVAPVSYYEIPKFIKRHKQRTGEN